MKFKFQQHIPNFCSGIDPVVFEFETIQELLDHNVIIRSRNSAPRFQRFSLSKSEYPSDRERLMVEGKKEDGSNWWFVVGYIEPKNELDLPTWTHG